MAKKNGQIQEGKADVREIVKLINGKFGTGSACLLQGGGGLPARVPAISTGVLAIDAALVIGGLPKGRVCEFFGPEGSGKSTVALMAVAACQRNGGVCAYIDMEQVLDPALAAACGVDLRSMIFSQPDSGDTAFNIIDALLEQGGVDLIVLDSVATLCFKEELEEDRYVGDQPSKVGIIARKMSAALRQFNIKAAKAGTALVFINQLRSQISAYSAGAPSETTPGGRALKFYSSIRLEIKRGKSIKNKEEAVGHELFVKVVKNKLAPPFRTAHCMLIYGKGIPEGLSLVDIAASRGVLRKNGSWIYYGEERLAQGMAAAAAKLEEDPELKSKIEREVRDTFGRPLPVAEEAQPEHPAQDAFQAFSAPDLPGDEEEAEEETEGCE